MKIDVYPVKICIVGQSGAGKDTMADCIVRHRPHAVRIAFADELKRLCNRMLNDLIDKEHLGIPHFNTTDVSVINDQKQLLRGLWQWMGTDLMRHHDNTFWIRKVEAYLTEHAFNSAVITDGRFQNEIDWARSQGFIIVKVSRTTHFSDTNDIVLRSHESEIGSFSIVPDIEYRNDGTVENMSDWVENVLMDMCHQRYRNGSVDYVLA